MKYLYVPVYRMAVSYVFSFGRRWSILEHMLLTESTRSKRTALELAKACDLPHRLIVEALINLLRANYVEVRSDDSSVYFAATPTGAKRAKEKSLPEQLQRDIRWDAMCVDRVTGHWMRADDLDLVYEKDLPAGATRLPPLLHTFEPNDAALRDLFRLNLNESLEPIPPVFRSPSLAFARVGIAFDEVQAGLPSNAPLTLRAYLVESSFVVQDDPATPSTATSPEWDEQARDHLTSDDFIVGGPAHRQALRHVLEKAKTAVVIHSCFLSAETLRELLVDMESAAAKRRVRIDLLWGLHTDPEASKPGKKLSDAMGVLSELSPSARGRVNLSPTSSGSHAKVILYDDRETGKWTTIVGSCNYLSSDFDWLEVSVRTRSASFATRVLSRLLSRQLPAVGNWSSTARRLNSIWSELKQLSRTRGEVGPHKVSLITDSDHYACIAWARDRARDDIHVVCDLYGLSAETSVLVPMETAAARGVKVKLQYTRPSKYLLEEGAEPTAETLARRGIQIERAVDVHAKYLAWDSSSVVVTSFNWLATSVDGKRSCGSEMGALVEGPGVRSLLTEKLVRQGGGSAVSAPIPS